MKISFQAEKNMKLKDFHQLIKTHSPNVLYYATKELVLQKNSKNKDAIQIAASRKNLFLVQALVPLSEQPPSTDLWLEAAKTNSIELATWLQSKEVRFCAGVVAHAAIHHSISFLTWICECLPLADIVYSCLISPFALQAFYKALSRNQQEKLIRHIQRYPCGYLCGGKPPIDSILFLFRQVPTRVIELRDHTTYSLLKTAQRPWKSHFLTLFFLEKPDIYGLLKKENVRHPGIVQLLYLLDGNTIEIQLQPIFIKRYVFDVLISFLLQRICTPSIILDYLGLEFCPGWLWNAHVQKRR